MLASDVLADFEVDGIQVRTARVDEFTVDDGEFYGRAVPYSQRGELSPGLFEVFEPGAFARAAKDPQRVKITLEHGDVVGRAVGIEDRPDGLWVRGRIVDDPDLPGGRKALAMMRNKLSDELSVGFVSVKGGTEVTEEKHGTLLVTHKRAALREIAVASWGVYGRGARVMRVRSAAAVEQETRWRAEWAARFAALG